jgi:hypothetical protein
MAEPVEGRGTQEAIGEGLSPLREVEGAGDDGSPPFITIGDEVVEVFILGWTNGLQAEVIKEG